MSADRWERIDELFADAIERPAGARAEFLATACGSDNAIREEVSSLLAAFDDSGSFLALPAIDLFARQISREGWGVRPGDRIGSYIVDRRLGAGGMGEVWRARDERLGRDVAIKLMLPHPSDSAAREQAFQREARVAGALNHTNLLTVHDVGNHDGAAYLVTECLEGQSLRARLRDGAVTVDETLDIALQVARGLSAAHARGVVHRDLKPENIFLSDDGRVKILDFGLATLHDTPPPGAPADDAAPAATAAPVAGTAAYMAPEQVRNEAVDQRADIFALGAVICEMLTGSQLFRGETTLATLDAVLTREPPDLAAANAAVPAPLAAVVRRALARQPHERFAAADDVAAALEEIIGARRVEPRWALRAQLRRPIAVAAALLVILATAAGGWQWWQVTNRTRWARTIAGPDARRLLNRGDYTEAFLLARRALDAAPDDQELNQLWLDASTPSFLASNTPGANVALAAYGTSSPQWFDLGQTPLTGVRLPRGLIRVRLSKSGYEPLEVAVAAPAPLLHLQPAGAVPPGMVHVGGGRDPVRFGAIGDLDDFWIDRFEITNRQFKEFVDRGGYERREFWREPFVEAGQPLSWDEAMSRFRDRTGRSGPATWNGGTYADGQADFPVGGVSWYEASAYAAFAGKQLPTVYHWYLAAGLGRFADILTFSNFNGGGPAGVGSHRGLGPFGTYDMAGNVKEWCANATTNGRFLLGGGWNDPPYMYSDYDARAPFARAPAYGFRLARYSRPAPAAVFEPVRVDQLAAARQQTPVDDEIFDVYRRHFAYDREPVNAVVEADENGPWRTQTLTVDAAYGGERMRMYLFLPKNSRPPYQTVIFFPAADAFLLRSSRQLSLARIDFILRSGRALLYPVYQGTYERAAPERGGPNAWREQRIAWSRDLGRAIDYLETRADIDRSRLAFYGISAGADAGVILTALEPRLRAVVLQGTGIVASTQPEIDAANYAPRVRMPTLMLNGRYDFESPYDTAQRPLFDLLGAPAADKRHDVFPTGHALSVEDVAGAIDAWLDRYLGTVPSR